MVSQVGDDWDQGVSEGVADHRAAAAHAFRVSHGHILASDLIKDRAPCQSRADSDTRECQRDCRENKSGAVRDSAAGQDLPLFGKDKDQDNGDPEAGEGQGHCGKCPQNMVQQPVFFHRHQDTRSHAEDDR